MTRINAPKHCDPTAYEWFEKCLPRLDTTRGLLSAAVAMSRHAMKDANEQKVNDLIAELANQVRSRWHGASTAGLLAHLHHTLFEEAGFRGNTADYYNPRNSYLTAVLSNRQGIPISLTLIYKAVAEELGLQVCGVNAPVHFLAEVRAPDDTFLVDVFHGGRLLTRNEARQLLESLIGAALPDDDRLFEIATHTKWITRMLRNLQSAYSLQGAFSDAEAMRELEELITSVELE
ncbi:MAG: transglutaminase family protein [Planctomycetales bacterium]|nr:transglutaminase family protein [Planctomycetales bacterium]